MARKQLATPNAHNSSWTLHTSTGRHFGIGMHTMNVARTL